MGKFRVGDRVRCIKEACDTGSRKPLLGRDGVVKRDDGSGYIPLLVEWTGWRSGHGEYSNEWFVNYDNVEKIEEDAVVKIGQEVRYIAVDNNVPQGTVGEVLEVYADRTLVKWRGWSEGWGGSHSKWWVDTSDLKVVNDGTIKIGLRVKTKTAKEGVVESNDGSEFLPWLVRYEDGGFDWYGADELTVIPEDSEEGLYIVIVEKDGKLAPAAEPRTYKTAKQANKVAEDMAKRHGGKFYAFKATFEATNIVNSRSL